MGDALVTVVIPTHDRVDLLREAVASALSTPEPEVRVVVVDDGSTDGTAAWLAGLPDPRVRVIRLDPSRERTAARNVGLAATTTPYVLFLDDDDLLAPGALAALVGGLERHPSAPVACGTYATFGTYGPEEVPRRQPIGRLPLARRLYREILWGWYLLPGMGLWRTDALRALGGWDESRDFAEDLELSLRVHPAPVALVPRVTLRYRQHGRGIDRSLEAEHEAMNDEVRAAFVSRLTGADRRRAEAVIAARPTFADGVRAYGDGDFRGSARQLVAGLRRVPALAVSPVLGPTLLGMVAKALIASVVPRRLRERLRAGRADDRAARFGPTVE